MVGWVGLPTQQWGSVETFTLALLGIAFQGLAQQYGIQGFPTIKLFPAGKKVGGGQMNTVRKRGWGLELNELHACTFSDNMVLCMCRVR